MVKHNIITAATRESPICRIKKRLILFEPIISNNYIGGGGGEDAITLPLQG